MDLWFWLQQPFQHHLTSLFHWALQITPAASRPHQENTWIDVLHFVKTVRQYMQDFMQGCIARIGEMQACWSFVKDCKMEEGEYSHGPTLPVEPEINRNIPHTKNSKGICRCFIPDIPKGITQFNLHREVKLALLLRVASHWPYHGSEEIYCVLLLHSYSQFVFSNPISCENSTAFKIVKIVFLLSFFSLKNTH